MSAESGLTGGFRVSRLRITNFLAFASAEVPGGRARFGSINLFVGPNGAGKSSILNALTQVAHRVAENSQMTVAANRDANDATGNPESGRAAAKCFCLEHHERAKRWELEAEVVIGGSNGVAEERGIVRMECGHPVHSQMPPWSFKQEGSSTWERLDHEAGRGSRAWRIREGVFPTGWPRLLFKLDQQAFAHLPMTTAKILEQPEGWARFHGDAKRLLPAEAWKSTELAAPYECECGAKEYWSVPGTTGDLARRGLGFALLDDHRVPLLHGSDGASHVAFMLMEIHKHSEPTSFVIEEPDAFLHPGLQRQVAGLLREAVEKYHHQFFITTHSPYLIDWAALADPGMDTRIFQVQYDAKRGAQVTEPLARDAGRLLGALGHSPSSVLQANGIIWVEGPSDAIYIQTWLDLWRERQPPPRPSIRWGIDANIQAYGGMLLPYFRGTAVEGAEIPPEFDALRTSTLRGFIVMDRDAGENEPSKTQWWWKCKLSVEKQFSPQATQGRWAAWLGAPSTSSIESYARRDLVESAGMKFDGSRWEAKSGMTKVKAASEYRRQVLERKLSFDKAVANGTDIEQRMREISDAIDSWQSPLLNVQAAAF